MTKILTEFRAPGAAPFNKGQPRTRQDRAA